MDVRREVREIWKHFDRYQEDIGEAMIYYKFDAETPSTTMSTTRATDVTSQASRSPSCGRTSQRPTRTTHQKAVGRHSVSALPCRPGSFTKPVSP